MKIQTIQSQLESLSNPEKKAYFPTFFKTGKGQYGERDLFIGIIVPDIRKVAKANKDITPEEIELLLNNSFHECRMCALMILVEQFKKRKKENERKSIFDFYLSHTSHINNWDLVDLSAKDIVGEYLADKQDRTVLYELAESSLLWDQRIAVIATFAFIKRHDFTDIIKLSEKLLYHKHDLMHKAIGWMLRETGKKNKSVLIGFLDKHHQSMPRTMLRYSIEKLSAEEKSYYMRKI